ncbi:MAG: hypothetical protein MJ118_05955 [Clostridia bacterium]|nr:hypothetical protein [Clostridia bacterium]
MWLSKRIMQQAQEPDAAALGTVTIGGEDAAVISDAEKRSAKIISPGGYCWQPSAKDCVLIVKGNELYINGRLQEEAKGLAAGEVRIFSGRSSVTLRRNGRVEIDGDVFINGALFVRGMEMEVP